MALSNGEQFVLLLWKNWLLQKRRIAITVFQILIPALFALVLLGIRFMYVPSDTCSSFNITKHLRLFEVVKRNQQIMINEIKERKKKIQKYSRKTAVDTIHLIKCFSTFR